MNHQGNPEAKSLRALGKRCVHMLLLVAALSCAGCGGDGFSGGSIPIGRGATITGKVILSLNPSSAVPNATLTVVSKYGNQQMQTTSAQTALDGSFIINSVATDSNGATVTVTVQPADTSLRPQQLVFVVAARSTQTLIASLAPVSYDITQAASISLSGPSAPITPGVPAFISAQVLDANGRPLPVAPSLLYYGNFGSLTGTGTFLANAVGSGTVIALWYGNLQSDSITIGTTASSPPGTTPPPPPTPTPVTAKSG